MRQAGPDRQSIRKGVKTVALYDVDSRISRLTFRSNGYNWEKYLRWLNRLYFRRHGRYYHPLVEIIYRYNNKERITRYLRQTELLTTELYRSTW